MLNHIEEIYNIAKNVEGKTPILFIAGARTIFKTIYQGNIINISNVENTRDLIQELSGIELEKPLVIDDLSLLYRDTLLLKFIEETKLKLVLLASIDNLSNTLLSRMKIIKKFPDDESLSYDLTSIIEAQRHIDTENLNQEETLDYLYNKCPDLIVLNKKLRYIKNKEKLIEIFGRIEDMHITK